MRVKTTNRLHPIVLHAQSLGKHSDKYDRTNRQMSGKLSTGLLIFYYGSIIQ